MRTTGPHVLIEPDDHDASSATVRGDDARHLATVLRVRVGDPVSLADGAGALLQARVRAVSPTEVSMAIVRRDAVPPATPVLTVLHALPKGRKLDEVVQRLSEIGVDRLVPLHSSRSVVRLDAPRAERAHARWCAVARAAAKQSRRARSLVVEPVSEWQAVFPVRSAGLVLWEESDRPLRAALAALPDDPPDLTLVIGPEGGLTLTEVTDTGLPAASLGPTILRTESAALVAATAVLYHFGRLG